MGEISPIKYQKWIINRSDFMLKSNEFEAGTHNQRIFPIVIVIVAITIIHVAIPCIWIWPNTKCWYILFFLKKSISEKYFLLSALSLKIIKAFSVYPSLLVWCFIIYSIRVYGSQTKSLLFYLQNIFQLISSIMLFVSLFSSIIL